MSTMNGCRPFILTREETLLLLEALVMAPTGNADALLWRLADFYREFDGCPVPSDPILRQEGNGLLDESLVRAAYAVADGR